MSYSKKEFQSYEIDLSLAVKRTEDKGNRIRQRVKSIRLGEYTDQYIRMKVIFPEGDERVLRPGEVVTVTEPRDYFILEWVAQSGKTVLVEVSEEIALQASPVPSTQTPQELGSSFTPNLQSVTTTPTLLVSANANRTKCTIENRGALTHYLGSLATLSDAAYKTKAIILNVGAVGEWKNSAGLYVRTESATDTNGFYTLDESK